MSYKNVIFSKISLEWQALFIFCLKWVYFPSYHKYFWSYHWKGVPWYFPNFHKIDEKQVTEKRMFWEDGYSFGYTCQEKNLTHGWNSHMLYFTNHLIKYHVRQFNQGKKQFQNLIVFFGTPCSWVYLNP